MKKIGIISVVFIFILTLCCSCFGEEITGKNIDVYTSDKATVYFYPVCPSCNHVSEIYSVNISEGESHETIHMCEQCYEIYDISIER